MPLLSATKYPKTADCLAAINSLFAKGANVVQVLGEDQTLYTMFSPSVSKEVMALRAARQWVSDPSLFRTLTQRLDEEPEEWR